MKTLKQFFYSILFCLAGFYGRAQDTVINPKSFTDTTKAASFIGTTSKLKPIANINTFYRLYVGAAYQVTKFNGQTKPFAAQHMVGLNYSLTERSFHPFYTSSFLQAIAGWNLTIRAGYDGIRRVNYYGVGNETVMGSPDWFNWLRTHHQYAGFVFDKTYAKHHNIEFGILYDGIQVLEDVKSFTAKQRGNIEPAEYNWQYFTGGQLTYRYTRFNNFLLPTKGFNLTTSASHTENIKRSGHSFSRINGEAELFVPLTNFFSMVVRTGAATVIGSPDFYQLNTVGGSRTIRGYQGTRFYGKTSFYNQNELRWITHLDHRVYKGYFGFVGVFDQGRVWHPNQTSTKMHTGFGGGLILAPMDKFLLTSIYAISNEDRRFHFRVGRAF